MGRELRKRFAGKPVAIALELAKGPIVYALRKYGFFVLFPVNPAALAKYRNVFAPSGAKDDPTDAELALEFLLKHPEGSSPSTLKAPGCEPLSSSSRCAGA